MVVGDITEKQYDAMFSPNSSLVPYGGDQGRKRVMLKKGKAVLADGSHVWIEEHILTAK